MSVDPRLLDLTARLDDLNERIERLETLEYGTLAFPAAGGAACDVTVGAPVASVTCLVRNGFLHLMSIIAAGLDTTGLTISKIRVTVSSLAAGYQYETRQENLFVIGDTMAAVFGVGAGAAFMETLRPSHRNFSPINIFQRNSGTYLFPDPGDTAIGMMTHQPRADIANTASWIGAGRMRSTGPDPLTLITGDDQGGGFQHAAPVGRITSVTWTAPPPALFIPGSRFMLYSL